MSRQRTELQESDVQGLRLIGPVRKLLATLHEAGTARDRAGNRQLHMDEYISLLLLYMFTPLCQSLRGVQQASELKRVQKNLRVPRVSLGSLSEAARVFDSALLEGLLGQVAANIQPLPHDPRLHNLGQVLTLVDGTLLKALPKMTWALWVDEEHKALKGHFEFELLKGAAKLLKLTAGSSSERQVLRESLAPNRLYVLDRGYAGYALLQEIHAAGSSFVVRLKDDAKLTVLEAHPLTEQARQAGVVFDATVKIGRGKTRQTVRAVRIECQPYQKTSGHKRGRSGPSQGETLLVVTDRLDLSADLIALIYQHRWQIEIFFRFFKHILGCRHLLSHCANGIELQVYAAILACLLITLWTGKKPTLRTVEMVAWYLAGVADEEEFLAHLNKLKQCD